MKWLLVEDWASHIYAEPFFQRLAELGEDVYAFKEHQYYDVDPTTWAPQRLFVQAQRRLRFGPQHLKLNLDLLHRVEDLRPDIVFCFRGDQILPSTLAAIKQRGPLLICWHNDNPFSPKYPWYVWRHAQRSVQLYDHLYAYRHENLCDFEQHGAKSSSLLRSFYLRELNFPIPQPQLLPYANDVSFIGHWEADGREDFIEALLKQPNLDFRLWGTLWERSRIAIELHRRFGEIKPLYKEAYNQAINASRISLAFFSGLNKDTYTRRCFEIPATGSFLLAQHTPDLATLFNEGSEAEFFRNPEEMIEKIRFYLAHSEQRQHIADQGRRRLLKDGHEALDRAQVVRADVLRLRMA
jgi:spore maturation protein CgeB